MRIPWIDCCKGLAMIMVVLGHCGDNEYLFKGLYYIHLPLFIMLSGFWIDNPKYYEVEYSLVKYSAKKAGELLYPYLIFGVMTFLLQYFRLSLINVNFDLGGANELLSNILHFENYANWFLPMLFFAEVLCMIMLKMFYNYKKKVLLIFIFMIICAFISSRIPKLLPYITNGTIYFLLFTFGKVFAFSFFCLIGYFIKKILDMYNARLKVLRKFMIPIMVLSSLTSLIVASNLPMVDLHTLRWESAKLYFVVACWGSISFIFMFYFLNISNRLLSHIGKNSLIINGTHLNLLIVPSVVQISFFMMPNFAGLFNLGPLIITAGVLFVEIFFVIPIIKNVYPFLSDYKIIVNKLNIS